MKASEVLWLIAFACIIAAPAMLRYDLPVGNDTYYYLAGLAPQGATQAFGWLMQLFGKTLPPLLFPLASALGVMLATWLIASLYTKSPLLATGLALSSPVFIVRFASIEDDLIGFPLALFALYFWLKYWETPIPRFGESGYEKTKLIASSCVLALASLWVWRGAELFIAFFVLHFLSRQRGWPWRAALAAFVLGAAWLGPKPSLFIGEQVPLIMFPIGCWLVGWGLLAIKRVPQALRLAGLWFGAYALLMSKFIVFAVPILAVLAEIHFFEGEKQRRTKEEIVAVACAGAVIGLMLVGVAPPSHAQFEAVQDAAAIAGNSSIANDWELGHWLKACGGNPIYSPLAPVEKEDFGVGEFVLSSRRSMPLPVERWWGGANLTLYRQKE